MSESKRITTLGALMDAMWTSDMSSRKTFAEIFKFQTGDCKVREYFDDGKGHSNAFTSRISDLDQNVLNDAKSRMYVIGKVTSDGTSSTEFVLTKEEYLLNDIWEIVASWRDEERHKRQSEKDIEKGLPGTYIKIVTVPDGEAPDWVRQAWVGLVLPCYPIVGYGILDDREKGVLTGENNDRNRQGYVVEQEEAIRVLSGKNQEAASWWKANGYPRTGSDNCFSFSLLEARELVGTFTHKAVEVHDERLDERLSELDH